MKYVVLDPGSSDPTYGPLSQAVIIEAADDAAVEETMRVWRRRGSFVIAGPLDPLDGDRLYWSNVDGWVDRESATLFPDTVAGRAMPDPLETTGREEADRG